MEQYKYNYDYNINILANSGKYQEKGLNNIDNISVGNEYIWNHNAQTYLAALGLLVKKRFSFILESIKIVRKVEAIKFSHKYEDSVIRLVSDVIGTVTI